MSDNNFDEFNNVANDVNIEELPYSEEAADLAAREASESARLIADMEEETGDLRESEFEERRKKHKKVVKKKTVAEEILDWLKTICIGIIAGVLLVLFVIQRDDVKGRSMMNTLQSGDVVFTQKISTYFKWYSRGDIVVLDGEGMKGYDHDEYLIKRIIGLPGDSVKIQGGNVYVKEKGSSEYFMLEENYLDPGTKTTIRGMDPEETFEITLGDDEYYCMGDNRPESKDSRALGPFTSKRIKGVAVIRLYPFNAIKLL